ncbi:PLDc N-terminal domain-containing protein [Aliarcobacter butzleri]|uniref:PLDc N-terminal domain-containing protein n=1 Tax=Aliarcobacter butzleri TaxID=28197 RepID=UPI00125FB255|nr:PLDc N-terminal domain-containing protein [Aliarcobacter butzleri]
MEIMLVIFILLVPIIVLIDVIRSDFKDSANKIIWIIILLVLWPIGWLLYLIFGRKQKIKKEDK